MLFWPPDPNFEKSRESIARVRTLHQSRSVELITQTVECQWANRACSGLSLVCKMSGGIHT